MVARADVFLHNLAPGAMARLGFDAPSLRSSHPRLVVCEIEPIGTVLCSHGLNHFRVAHAPDIFVDRLAFDDLRSVPLLNNVAHVKVGIAADHGFWDRR